MAVSRSIANGGRIPDSFAANPGTAAHGYDSVAFFLQTVQFSRSKDRSLVLILGEIAVILDVSAPGTEIYRGHDVKDVLAIGADATAGWVAWNSSKDVVRGSGNNLDVSVGW